MGIRMERDVLGADDAAGIYIMLCMIEAGIDGTYVFHADEEIGCIGSQALAECKFSVDGYDLEEDFTHAIAFDRKGTSDLITWQMGEQLCSSKCAVELMGRFNEGLLSYRIEHGVVTDTAMYSDLVEECINLSVGYYDEHTTDERLDLGHLYNLTSWILEHPKMFNGLPVDRDLDDYGYGDDSYHDNFSYTKVPDDDPVKSDTVAALVLDHPHAVADVLEGFFGVDYDELFHLLNAESM